MKLFFQTDILCLSILNTESWEKILLKLSSITFTFYCFYNVKSKRSERKAFNSVLLTFPLLFLTILQSTQKQRY